MRAALRRIRPDRPPYETGPRRPPSVAIFKARCITRQSIDSTYIKREGRAEMRHLLEKVCHGSWPSPGTRPLPAVSCWANTSTHPVANQDFWRLTRILIVALVGGKSCPVSAVAREGVRLKQLPSGYTPSQQPRAVDAFRATYGALCAPPCGLMSVRSVRRKRSKPRSHARFADLENSIEN